MRVEHFMNFDTHGAVKRLIAVGLENRIAEEVVTSIALGRDYDFSKLVTKEEFFKSKEKASEKFNKIETEIALVKQEIKALRKEFKAEIDGLRKEMEIGLARLSAEITKSKHDTLKWVIGLFIIQVTSIIGFFATILIKSYF